MLSLTMVEYLKEKMWLGDTTKEEMLKRSDKLYKNGYWSRTYIGINQYTYEEAVEESIGNN